MSSSVSCNQQPSHMLSTQIFIIWLLLHQDKTFPVTKNLVNVIQKDISYRLALPKSSYLTTKLETGSVKYLLLPARGCNITWSSYTCGVIRPFTVITQLAADLTPLMNYSRPIFQLSYFFQGWADILNIFPFLGVKKRHCLNRHSDLLESLQGA